MAFKRISTTFVVAAFMVVSSASAGVEQDLSAAAGPVQAVLEGAEPLVADGRVAEVNAKLLAVFPEKTRTPVQALLLGNVLFKQDPVTSYALHKQAAAGLPNEPDAQLEWALEQHRAGEFAGAAESYQKFVNAQPKFGPVLGLLADCLIRTGKTREAVDAWVRSEKGNGSLETLESWVCDVHAQSYPDRDRAVLYTKAKAGDPAAAVKLVAGDCNFQNDWWNIGPKPAYLVKDLELLRRTKFPPTAADSLREAACAAECGIIVAKEEGDAAATLKKANYLLDDKATLPKDGAFLSLMLAAAENAHAITAEQAREKFGPAVLALAKSGKQADVFNVAANLYLHTDQLADIDQQGWDATGDNRFAVSRIVGLLEKDQLKMDDPRLAKAVKQFPDDANLARVVAMLTARAKQPTDAVIVTAIKAEFTHFSIGGDMLGSGRPSAQMLRSYFAALAKSMNVK